MKGHSRHVFFSFLFCVLNSPFLRKIKSIFHNVQSRENGEKKGWTSYWRAVDGSLRFILSRVIIYKNPTICQFSLQLVFSSIFMTVFVRN